MRVVLLWWIGRLSRLVLKLVISVLVLFGMVGVKCEFLVKISG